MFGLFPLALHQLGRVGVISHAVLGTALLDEANEVIVAPAQIPHMLEKPVLSPPSR